MTAPLSIVYLLESTGLWGGVRVVLLQAEALARRGHRVAVVSPEPAPEWFSLRRARFERSSFRDSTELSAAAIRVATFWTTVEPALDGARGAVFHLCQGYEGDFSFYSDRREAIERAYGARTRKLAISETLAARLARHGFGPVTVVGQAFDGADFRPGPGRAAADPPVVLLVGPFEADVKGIGIALEGLARYRRRGGRFRLRRVSTFAPTAAERATGLVEEYHHHLPPERMPFAYRASDLFVGPSRPEEGFGLPVLEALSCGVPCLLSDTPGHREIAGAGALYFRDGDPESLAAAFPEALSEEAQRQARAEGPRIAARFTVEGVAEKLERAFEGAVGGLDRPHPGPLPGGEGEERPHPGP
ncbi:MAG: glycosyltransferase family 4 protein, partial [Thermoanaerobaculia bacterium]